MSADGDVSGLVDIGNGRTLYLECRGNGSPTVVFISGLTGGHDQWQYSLPANDPDAEITENDQAVLPTAARSTRACAYDRPNTNTIGAGPGRSTPVAQPTTSAAAWNRYVALVSTAPESKDLVAGNAALDDLPPLSPIPVVVLSSDQPWSTVPSELATFEDLAAGRVRTVDSSNAWDEAQALLAESLGATHITQTNSGHEIEIENAPLVNQQICAVIGPTAGC